MIDDRVKLMPAETPPRCLIQWKAAEHNIKPVIPARDSGLLSEIIIKCQVFNAPSLNRIREIYLEHKKKEAIKSTSAVLT